MVWCGGVVLPLLSQSHPHLHPISTPSPPHPIPSHSKRYILYPHSSFTHAHAHRTQSMVAYGVQKGITEGVSWDLARGIIMVAPSTILERPTMLSYSVVHSSCFHHIQSHTKLYPHSQHRCTEDTPTTPRFRPPHPIHPHPLLLSMHCRSVGRGHRRWKTRQSCPNSRSE